MAWATSGSTSALTTSGTIWTPRAWAASIIPCRADPVMLPSALASYQLGLRAALWLACARDDALASGVLTSDVCTTRPGVATLRVEGLAGPALAERDVDGGPAAPLRECSI